MLTEILLEVTNEEIEGVATETFDEEKSKLESISNTCYTGGYAVLKVLDITCIMYRHNVTCSDWLTRYSQSMSIYYLVFICINSRSKSSIICIQRTKDQTKTFQA